METTRDAKKERKEHEELAAAARAELERLRDTPNLIESRLAEELASGELDESEYFDRLFVLRRQEEAKRSALVTEALGKFNFFLHLTAFVTGCAYLLLLGILVSSTLPYIFIPIGLWAVGISYHFYRAFIRMGGPPRRVFRRRMKPEAKAGSAAAVAAEAAGLEEGSRGSAPSEDLDKDDDQESTQQ